MYYVWAILIVSLGSIVSADLASLRRFAQGGPPPPAGARQVAGGGPARQVAASGARSGPHPAGARQVAGSGLNRLPSSPPVVGSSDTRPSSIEVTSAPAPRQDAGVFFPFGSKVIKHVALPKVPAVKSNATPLPTPEHSTLMKVLDQSGPESSGVSGPEIVAADLVRIPKNQAMNLFQLQTPPGVPNAPLVQQTLPTQLESLPVQPAFARIPKLQPSNPVPSTPPQPQVHHVEPENKFQPDESLFAPDNAEVFSNPPQLSDEELELEAAVSMIRNNWHFVKSGGRLIISHKDDDLIIIAKDSLFRREA